MRQASAGRWARYDTKVEALLGMGAAGVVETLMRTVARNLALDGARADMLAQVHHSSQCCFSMLARTPVGRLELLALGVKAADTGGSLGCQCQHRWP